MNPVLIHNGKSQVIQNIEYKNGAPVTVTVTNNNNKEFYFHEPDLGLQHAIDLDKSIYWRNRYDPIFEGIEVLSNEYQTELNNLSKEISDLVTYQGYVHPEITDRYKALKTKIDTINEVINTIHFMSVETV